MSDQRNFLQHVMAGKAQITEIDDFVERWHQGNSAEDLHDYLGMSAEEYALWLENPDMLVVICAAKREHKPLAQAVEEHMPELRLAARSRDRAKLGSLESWLRKQGMTA